MKSLFAALIIAFTPSLMASETNGCIEEIAAEVAQLLATKAKHLELFIEMEKFDRHLEEHADLLDYKIVSALDEGINLGKSRNVMQKAGNSVSTLVNTENIVAKTRLVYLRAAILRYQFYVSKMSEEDLRSFHNEP